MRTIVYLIRHGETAWNADGRWQGHADIPLNEKGIEQSRLLAQRLINDGIVFDYIYSSDLTRAYQTAWEVGSVMKVAVELLPPLREIDVGKWSGLTKKEIQERFPVESELIKQGQDIPRGGGETLANLQDRVVKVIGAMVHQHPGEHLAFFSHGGPIRAMLRHVKPDFDTVRPPCRRIGNTSLHIVQHDPKNGWQLVTCNDVKHLQGTEHDPGLLTTHPDDVERQFSLTS
jgi:probable phosphoglycerate mutase